MAVRHGKVVHYLVALCNVCHQLGLKMLALIRNENLLCRKEAIQTSEY